jgi:arginine deiminase
VSADDLPDSFGGKTIQMFRDFLGHSSFILPPLPNTQFTRDTTCWIYGGVTLNPMYWPARRQETLLTTAIYKFHPEFTNADFQIWYGDPDKDHGSSTLEGGDVMPIGNGVVLIGMGERSSRQAIGQLALNLFKNKAVEKVIVAGLPKSRAAMHLDTVFSFCDRDLVTIFPEVVNQIVAFTLRPDESKQGGIDIRREEPTSSTPWPSPQPERSCAWSKPAATASPPSASSGTTATTWWPWNPAWSSAMTATPTPTPCCARPASRSSPSAPANSAVAVAAATA